jgi:hypothetical protein
MSSSVEGLTSATEREIQELPIGTSVVTGITDVPLFVNVRPRKSLHGGAAVDILNSTTSLKSDEPSLLDQVQEFSDAEVLPLFFPGMEAKDVMLMSERPVAEVQLCLIPVLQVQCVQEETSFSVLVDLTTGAIITDKDEYALDQNKGSKMLPALDRLSKQELQVLHAAFQLQSFTTTQIVGKVGLVAQTHLDKLVSKGLIVQQGTQYELSSRYIFSKLENFKEFSKPRYEQISYASKQDPILNIDAVITQLQKFTDVKDHAQGFFVTYQIQYKE